jgi:hypothetical protein
MRVDVWTDGSETARRKLREFVSDRDCTLWPETSVTTFGTHEGRWIVPIELASDGGLTTESADRLRAAARRMWFALAASAAP